MIRNSYLVLVVIALISCREANQQEDFLVDGLVKKQISSHWTMQFPLDAQFVRQDSFVAPTWVVTFPNDSLRIQYQFWQGDVEDDDDCTFSTRARQTEQGVGSICQGDGSMDIDYSAVVNPSTRVIGIRGDWCEDGRRFVSFRVNDCRTGECLDITFGGIGFRHESLIAHIIMSLEFQSDS